MQSSASTPATEDLVALDGRYQRRHFRVRRQVEHGVLGQDRFEEAQVVDTVRLVHLCLCGRA